MTKLAEKLNEAKKTTTLPPHIVISALAGTGKSTTLIEGVKLLFGLSVAITPSKQQQAIWDAIMRSQTENQGETGFFGTACFVAFNKSIATELQQRVPEGCAAMTMHSMGLKAVTNSFGRVKVNSYRTQDLISELLETDIRDLRKKKFEMVRATEKLVGLCKMNMIGVDTPNNQGDWLDVQGMDEALDQLAAHYDVELNGSRSEVFDLVPRVLERAKDVARDSCIDFNDMVWVPTALDLPVTKYDLLLVDECQDLSKCQQRLAKKAGHRLVFCGDKHQAIYGFAGADAESMGRLQSELEASPQGCIVLPLTATRRCGKAIVAEAKRIVPGFESHESNGVGDVSSCAFQSSEDYQASTDICYLDIVQEGDMCLCRVNAPLVTQCFKLLKQGRKAEIQGRDVGQGLVKLVKKLDAMSVLDLVGKLSDWLRREEEKESRKRIPSESRLINLADKHDCLVCFTEDASTVDGVISSIERLFTDGKDKKSIKFSSIHKAKGLEAKRVFLLEPEGATVPHPMATSDWQVQQEWNCRYIAITRAIDTLVYVS